MDDRRARRTTAALAARFSRRRLFQIAAIGALGPVAACGDGGDATVPAGNAAPEESSMASPDDMAGSGRLASRPFGEIPSPQATTGLRSLGIGRPEDAILYVPLDYSLEKPAPLAILFHGAGGDASGAINVFQDHAGQNGIILLATKSRGVSWDIATSGGFGSDIAFLDRVLGELFSRYAVDPAHIAVAGFSDGASYALAVGLTNGTLVTDIIAFSPGFLAPGDVEGMPRVFISHGTADIVLPIDQTSRVIVPQLREAGYAVEYVEFDGLHMVPEDVIDEAVTWWLSGA